MPTPYAPNWSTVNVRGTYRLGDNTPDSGSVVFTFTDRITDAEDDLIFASGGSFEVKLGASTGSISVDLPCVDDPSITPNNWSIKVEERLKSGRGATYYIKPTLAMAAAGLNLRSVLVPGSLPAPEATVRIGVPGGLAVYNSNGDLVDAAGNVILGGGGGGGGGTGTGTVTSGSITDASALGRSILRATTAPVVLGLIGAAATSDLGAYATKADLNGYATTGQLAGKLDASTKGKPGGVAAVDTDGDVVDASGVKVKSTSVTTATIPAGSVLYTSTTARPTARTDVMVIFTGADPGANALDNDMWWSA